MTLIYSFFIVTLTQLACILILSFFLSKIIETFSESNLSLIDQVRRLTMTIARLRPDEIRKVADDIEHPWPSPIDRRTLEEIEESNRRDSNLNEFLAKAEYDAHRRHANELAERNNA
jgi:hypothetical protein